MEFSIFDELAMQYDIRGAGCFYREEIAARSGKTISPGMLDVMLDCCDSDEEEEILQNCGRGYLELKSMFNVPRVVAYDNDCGDEWLFVEEGTSWDFSQCPGNIPPQIRIKMLEKQVVSNHWTESREEIVKAVSKVGYKPSEMDVINSFPSAEKCDLFYQEISRMFLEEKFVASNSFQERAVKDAIFGDGSNLEIYKDSIAKSVGAHLVINHRFSVYPSRIPLLTKDNKDDLAICLSISGYMNSKCVKEFSPVEELMMQWYESSINGIEGGIDRDKLPPHFNFGRKDGNRVTHSEIYSVDLKRNFRLFELSCPRPFSPFVCGIKVCSESFPFCDTLIIDRGLLKWTDTSDYDMVEWKYPGAQVTTTPRYRLSDVGLLVPTHAFMDFKGKLIHVIRDFVPIGDDLSMWPGTYGMLDLIINYPTDFTQFLDDRCNFGIANVRRINDNYCGWYFYCATGSMRVEFCASTNCVDFMGMHCGSQWYSSDVVSLSSAMSDVNGGVADRFEINGGSRAPQEHAPCCYSLLPFGDSRKIDCSVRGGKRGFHASIKTDFNASFKVFEDYLTVRFGKRFVECIKHKVDNADFSGGYRFNLWFDMRRGRTYQVF